MFISCTYADDECESVNNTAIKVKAANNNVIERCEAIKTDSELHSQKRKHAESDSIYFALNYSVNSHKKTSVKTNSINNSNENLGINS